MPNSEDPELPIPSTPIPKIKNPVHASTPKLENYKPFQTKKQWELNHSPMTEAWIQKHRPKGGLKQRRDKSHEVSTSDAEEEELDHPPQRLFRPKHKFPIQDPNAVYLLHCFHCRCEDLEALLESHKIPIPGRIMQIK